MQSCVPNGALGLARHCPTLQPPPLVLGLPHARTSVLQLGAGNCGDGCPPIHDPAMVGEPLSCALWTLGFAWSTSKDVQAPPEGVTVNVHARAIGSQMAV